MTEQLHTIVDTAVSAGSFKTLTKALTAAGLIDALKGPGPFTVFAPTDAAFAKLSPGVVDGWLKPEAKDKLVALLKHHVVEGKVTAQEAEGKKIMPKSMQGDPLHIDGMNGLSVNGAKVTKAGIACTNGLIHVIDTVLTVKSAAPASEAARPAKV